MRNLTPQPIPDCSETEKLVNTTHSTSADHGSSDGLSDVEDGVRVDSTEEGSKDGREESKIDGIDDGWLDSNEDGANDRSVQAMAQMKEPWTALMKVQNTEGKKA